MLFKKLTTHLQQYMFSNNIIYTPEDCDFLYYLVCFCCGLGLNKFGICVQDELYLPI